MLCHTAGHAAHVVSRPIARGVQDVAVAAGRVTGDVARAGAHVAADVGHQLGKAGAAVVIPVARGTKTASLAVGSAAVGGARAVGECNEKPRVSIRLTCFFALQGKQPAMQRVASRTSPVTSQHLWRALVCSRFVSVP